MSVTSATPAQELHEWFQRLRRITEATHFEMVPAGPHREALVLDVLRRNARIVKDSDLDLSGRLYSPICFFLVAACQRLGVELGMSHWRAALDNVNHLRNQLETHSEQLQQLGLELAPPAELFKNEFSEAIRQAGLIEGATFLTQEHRKVALGLAVNWAMRLLLAYAMQVPATPLSSEKRDLSWLANQVASAHA